MKTGSPKVSIIVPTFNAAPYLPALCDSLLGQTYTNFEALFYNDGSTDTTLEALKPYQKDARFRVFGNRVNRGVNAATNALFAVFQGKYWCHPGADDLLLPDFLESRVSLMESSENAVLVHGPASKIVDEHGHHIEQTDNAFTALPTKINGEEALAVLLQHNVIATPSIMARSSITRQVLPYFQTDWKYAQDWYLWLLHAATAGDLLWDPNPLHIYRVHSSSLTNNPQKAAVRQAEIRLVPLTAISRATNYSLAAGAVWEKWKGVLYDLWLVRIVSLRKNKAIQPKWIKMASDAFYQSQQNTSLNIELLKRGPSIFTSFLRERWFFHQQAFRVSGLAQINHPIFRRVATTSP